MMGKRLLQRLVGRRLVPRCELFPNTLPSLASLPRLHDAVITTLRAWATLHLWVSTRWNPPNIPTAVCQSHTHTMHDAPQHPGMPYDLGPKSYKIVRRKGKQRRLPVYR